MNTTESIGKSTTHTAKRPDSFTTPFRTVTLIPIRAIRILCPVRSAEVKYFIRNYTIFDIKQIVYSYFNLTESEVEKKGQGKHFRSTWYLADVRHFAMYFCYKYKLEDWTLKQIARNIGGYDHATASHAKKKIKGLIQFDPKFRSIALKIDRNIRQKFNINDTQN